MISDRMHPILRLWPGKSKNNKTSKILLESKTSGPIPQILYRYMSLDELSNILSYGAFTRLIDFDEDCDGKIENPAGDMPFFKSFTYKLTKEGLEDFMGPGHVICAFNTGAFPKKNPLLPYTYDSDPSATHEYEYRLFSNSPIIKCDLGNLIKGVIFCRASGEIDKDDIESLLLDLRDSGIRANVGYISNPLRKSSKRVIFELNDEDELEIKK